MLNKRKYNILYTTSFAHMMGGGQWSLYYLIKHLDKNTFHPIVLCPSEGELAKKMRGVGAEVVCFAVGRIRYLNLLIIKKFISLIKQKHIALIHTDSTNETFYAGIAARMMRIPLVWHIRVSEREWFLDLILSLFSTKLILVAEAITRRFARLTKSHKIIVINNGIDLEEFDNFPARLSLRNSLNIGKDMVLLGCIGRIEKSKGQEYLIPFMRLIDNSKIIFVGTGEKKYISRIKMLGNKLGIGDRVIFLGSRSDIPAVLKEIDIVVFPSIRGEGFPRVILEAMAAGKPVIATDQAGNLEAVMDGRTGFIIPKSNFFEFADKIILLAANKKKLRAMGEAGRKRVEKNFPIQKNVKKIHELYLDILSKLHEPENEPETSIRS